MYLKKKCVIYEKKTLLDLCQGCIIDGGLGYANHPSSCERFIVCYPGEGGKLVPIEQQCPHGLFWSQKALTCRLPKDVLCPYGEFYIYDQ